MKHLFYVHSHITYYISVAIINKLGLKLNEVVFVKSRNYNNTSIDKDSVTFSISRIHHEIDGIGKLDFYKTYKYINQIDSLIHSNLNNSEFNVYLPMIRHKAMQIIATHKNCKQINIIEEGVIAYSKHFTNFKEKKIIVKIGKIFVNDILNLGKSRFFYLKPFDLRRFKDKERSVFYTISNLGYKGLPYNIEKIELQEDPNITYTVTSKTVLVLEGAVEQGNLKIENFIDAVKFIIKDNEIEDKQISIKYHPAQSKENINKIVNTINELGVKPISIPNNIPFEQFAIKNNNLMVLGFTTSLLFYAKELGCSVKSYESLLLKDELFLKYRQENNFNLQELLKA